MIEILNFPRRQCRPNRALDGASERQKVVLFFADQRKFYGLRQRVATARARVAAGRPRHRHNLSGSREVSRSL